MLTRLSSFIMVALLAACGGEARAPVASAAEPMRIVSMDYCADQYVLKFAGRDRILALSPGAAQEFSYMREEAVGIPTVPPSTEDILILKPDLIVRSYGGGPRAAAFFERAGIPVLNVGWAADIPAVMENTERLAAGLGAAEAGRDLVQEMRARLGALPEQGGSVLYMTPGGVTSGPSSLVHEMIVAAGRTNFQTAPGWNPLPLERLVYEKPDRIAAAFFGTPEDRPDPWSPMKHPIAKAQLAERPVIALDGAWTACGGWFVMEAIEALAAEGGT